MSYVPTAADWRDLAREIQNETDPIKMIELAQELVARLDAEQLRNGGGTENSSRSLPAQFGGHESNWA